MYLLTVYFWICVLIFLAVCLIEWYFLQAVKVFSQDFSPNTKQIILWITYILAAYSISMGLLNIFNPPYRWSPSSPLRLFFGTAFLLLICKILGSSFLLIDDLIRLFRWLWSLIASKPKTEEAVVATQGINRLKFLSQLAITFTVVPAVGFLYGIVRGAYKYRVHNVKIPSPNLPEAFNGFKIVQLSDIHTGSFANTNPLNKAFDIVMQQNADLILFTGDLVNNISEEVAEFTETFKCLKAPHGVYSVLGNHDYGDYVEWDNLQSKQQNFEKLKATQKSCGWHLLMNEHIAIEKNGQHIGLIGVENWGGSLRFPRYGKLNEAYAGAEKFPFKILMTHDPSHWDKQVRPEYGDIDLTLSGHTHGMQMGIEIPGILKWSPASWVYKQWAGLYKDGKQFLYVNRGLGFLGYPGRLGIWPEITVIELQRV
ncbi:MAG: metallophosphoesterase [Bacteroidetes bacterium]|nr:metallophosphoesterase [Bacteroidota bacterium]